MRTLFLTHHYPNADRPLTAASTRQLVDAVAAHHPVEVIAPVAWSNGPQLPQMSHEVETWHPRRLSVPHLFRRLDGLLFRQAVRKTFEQRVAAFQPTLVCAPWAYPDGWAAVELGRRHQLPVVIQILGPDLMQLDGHPARQRALEALREADAVIAMCQDLANRVLSLGLPAQRVHCIRPGVDAGLFTPGPQEEARARLALAQTEPLLLCVADLETAAGLSVLVDACAILQRTACAFCCRIIGDGPLRGELERQIAIRGLSEHVGVLAALPEAQLADWHRAADVVVCPTYSAGVPDALLAAVACARPIVASRVGGIPEVVDPQTSRLVDAGDAEALAQAIELMLQSPGEQPQASGQPRTWASVAAEVCHLFERVCHGRRRFRGTARQRSIHAA